MLKSRRLFFSLLFYTAYFQSTRHSYGTANAEEGKAAPAKKKKKSSFPLAAPTFLTTKPTASLIEELCDKIMKVRDDEDQDDCDEERPSLLLPNLFCDEKNAVACLICLLREDIKASLQSTAIEVGYTVTKKPPKASVTCKAKDANVGKRGEERLFSDGQPLSEVELELADMDEATSEGKPQQQQQSSQNPPLDDNTRVSAIQRRLLRSDFDEEELSGMGNNLKL